jgi:hypothetical protein
VNYQEIVDISEHRTFSVRISNTQDRSILKCFKPEDGTHFTDFGPIGTNSITAAHIFNAGGVGNGVLSLRVVNRLTAPTDDIHTEVGILVSIRACEDFRVYVPDDTVQKIRYVVPQSGIEPIDSRIVHSVDHSIAFDVKGDMSDLSHVYIGEDIYSLRTLLKRYVLYLPISFGSGTLAAMTRIPHAIYPLMPGYARDTIHLDGTATGYNYVGHSYISFFRVAFAAIRGSTRWKYLPYWYYSSPKVDVDIPIMVAREEEVETGDITESVIDGSTNNSFSHDLVLATRKTIQGMQATVTSVNSTLEFEVPFYSDHRFVVGPSSDECKVNNDVSGFALYIPRLTSTQLAMFFCAAGEDFSLSHFFGFPRMVYDPTMFPDTAADEQP